MPNRVMPPSRYDLLLRRTPTWVIRLWDTPIHWLYAIPVAHRLANLLHHRSEFIYEACLTLEIREAEEYIRKAEAEKDQVP